MNRVMGSNKDTQHDLEGLPRHIALTAASPTYQMLPSDNVVSLTSNAADGIAIVTLPAVSEAVGQHYYVVAPTGAAAGDISLWEKETGAELATNGDMDADGDHLILYSTGISWLTRLDGVA